MNEGNGMDSVKSCVECHCNENCTRLNRFCRDMVFQLRRLDITLIESLAGACPFYFVPANVGIKDEQPQLFVLQGGKG